MTAPPGLLRRVLSEMPRTFGLAFPIIVGLAAATLIGLVDTIMIAPLGTEPLAAAGLTSSILTIFLAALYGLIAVASILMAQASGSDEPDLVSARLRNGLALAALAGLCAAAGMILLFPVLHLLGQPPQVLAILLPYWIAMACLLVPFSALYLIKGLFEAIERPWMGTAFALIGVLVNIPLNWLLIYGLGPWEGLGLLGAGLASLFAQSFALLCAWLYWIRARSMAPYRAPARLSLRTMRALLSQGWPVALTYTGEGLAYAVVGIMLGWLGAAALAANQMVGSIGSILYMLPLGMAAAVGIRIAQVVGAGQHDRTRAIGLGAIGSVVAWMALVAGLLILWRRDIALALSDDPEVIAVASVVFLSVALMQVADGIQSTAMGALRGMSDNLVPAGVSILANWVIALPLAYLLGIWLEMGPGGVWIGYGLGLMTAAIALAIRFLRKSA